MPLASEEGELYINSPVRILESNSHDGLTVDELIDGDVLGAEDIKERLRSNAQRLDAVQGRETVHWLEVFVFDGEPEAEKLRAITEGQYLKPWDRRFLPCITISDVVTLNPFAVINPFCPEQYFSHTILTFFLTCISCFQLVLPVLLLLLKTAPHSV
jgi:hypothetical protein